MIKVNSMRKNQLPTSINWVFLLLIIFSSCRKTPMKEALEKKPYYDLNAFLDAEIKCLFKLSNDVIATKTTTIKGKKQSKKIVLDSVQLSKELEVIRQLDINIPSLRKAYWENNSTNWVIYTRKKQEEKGVKHLKILKDDEGNILSLEGLITEGNLIYKSVKKIKLQGGADNCGLRSYEMTGSQKMVFQDSATYGFKVVLL